MDIKGSKTEKNLLMTFAGEARARDKYDFYGEKANQEGLQYIGDVFKETAHNEYAHAREAYGRFLKKVRNTEMNLLDAAQGESEESNNIYKEFEKTARMEGFEEVANFFKELAEVEENHEKRFMDIYNQLKAGTLYKKDKPSRWQCTNCGYIYEGTEVPAQCPLCKFPRGYFAPYCEKH